jgi:hypothetical protein
MEDKKESRWVCRADIAEIVPMHERTIAFPTKKHNQAVLAAKIDWLIKAWKDSCEVRVRLEKESNANLAAMVAKKDAEYQELLATVRDIKTMLQVRAKQKHVKQESK